MGTVHRLSPESVLNLTQIISPIIDPEQFNFAWTKWIRASINKHFEDIRSEYPLYLEGDERIESEENDFAELRIDGPAIKFLQKKLFFLDVQINVLVSSRMDPKNLYRDQLILGNFLLGFTNLIEVRRYGDGPTDDGSLLDCLHLQRDKKEVIDINNFGIIRQDTRITQQTMEGHYRLEVWNG